MRKLSIALAAILMAIIGFTSCSQDGELNNIASESKAISCKVTVEEAKANVLDFINNLNKSNTRAFPTKCISIANVKPISIKAGTRAGASVNNGYFLSNVLNAEEAPVYDDYVTSSTRSSNFRYKLKTATFTK